MSKMTEDLEVFGSSAKTCTLPILLTTNQRLESRGARSIKMGTDVSPVAELMKESLGNTRCVPSVTLPVARSGAMHVVLLGRASSPLTGVTDPGGGGCGGGFAGGLDGLATGGSFDVPLPPPQPVIKTTKQMNTPVPNLG